jgi:uncharacterized repeat protein (TIGR04138 family)
MQAVDFEEVLEKILAQDSRYHRDAYLFVREGLDYTQRPMAKASRNEVRHVSGQELLNGLRKYAVDQFGPMTLTVLNEWGIHRCEDFGEIVFRMVDFGLLSKSEADSREDFKGVYDFEEAFRKPFLPAARPAPTSVTDPAATKLDPI